MPVEFLGIAATNDGSETAARSGPAFDKEYTLRLARAHEENGWDRVLFAYGSGSSDPNIGAAYIAGNTDKLQLLLAHRPNVSYPTFAAKTFATVDQVSNGRMTVHFITGPQVLLPAVPAYRYGPSAKRWITAASHSRSCPASPGSDRSTRLRVDTPSTNASIAAALASASASARPLASR